MVLGFPSPQKRKRKSLNRSLLFIYADSAQLRFANLVIKKEKEKERESVNLRNHAFINFKKYAFF